MNKVFVDSDVILDLLAHRLPHFHFSALLFTFADMKKLELYTSPTVFCNVFYILRKELGIEKAKEALRKLRLIVNIIDSTEKTIDRALNSDFSDFEDAIRNAISIGGDSDTIAAITGSVAEAYYGIPHELIDQAKTYIPDDLLEIVMGLENL